MSFADLAMQTYGADSEEYTRFLDKFKPKRTTDDCYTPDTIYEVVADYVSMEYSVDRERFVRPFYPGGDYINEEYPEDCVVVDNPPFSILTQIINFYLKNEIKYFLFAPGLTTLKRDPRNCSICVGATITYENGATINTSFCTNLEEGYAKTAPKLYEALKLANQKNTSQTKKIVSKIEYPAEVVTAAKLEWIGKHGGDIKINKDNAVFIGRLDAMGRGKGIYGHALLLSRKATAEKVAAEKVAAEKVAAEKVAAEKAAIEKKAAVCYKLSPREREIVESIVV